MVIGYIIQIHLRNSSWTSEFGTDLENFISLWWRKLTRNIQKYIRFSKMLNLYSSSHFHSSVPGFDTAKNLFVIIYTFLLWLPEKKISLCKMHLPEKKIQPALPVPCRSTHNLNLCSCQPICTGTPKPLPDFTACTRLKLAGLSTSCLYSYF